jgi:hypothetical protein
MCYGFLSTLALFSTSALDWRHFYEKSGTFERLAWLLGRIVFRLFFSYNRETPKSYQE